MVSVYSYSRAELTDTNETCLFGELRVIAATSATGNDGLIAMAYVTGQYNGLVRKEVNAVVVIYTV